MSHIYILFTTNKDCRAPEDSILGVFTSYYDAKQCLRNHICDMYSDEYREEKIKHFEKHFQDDLYVDVESDDEEEGDKTSDWGYYIKSFNVGRPL